jgi:hypothetical protein
VHRARAQRLQRGVVFAAVELERVDAARAFFGIEGRAAAAPPSSVMNARRLI